MYHMRDDSCRGQQKQPIDVRRDELFGNADRDTTCRISRAKSVLSPEDRSHRVARLARLSGDSFAKISVKRSAIFTVVIHLNVENR